MEYLRELNLLSITFRVVLAMLIGGALGIERLKNNHPAGFRTHMLVCLGAALVMMTNQYVYQFFHTSDPVRMGAQVVSGIGFLGAGTIIVTGRQQIRGITTAAGLWAAACCGLAIGIGFYEGAIVVGLLILLVMSTMNNFNGKIRSRSNIIELYIEYTKTTPFSAFLSYIRDNHLEIIDLQLNKSRLPNTSVMSFVIVLKSTDHKHRSEIMHMIEEFDSVQYLEEL